MSSPERENNLRVSGPSVFAVSVLLVEERQGKGDEVCGRCP